MFTYDLKSANEDKLLISKVRLEIGDKTANAGVLPSGDNLSDEEILTWLDDEDNNVMLTAARACDAIARSWAGVASYNDGPRGEQLGKVSEEWSKRAKDLRDQYGSGSSGSSFAVGVARTDGYAEAAE